MEGADADKSIENASAVIIERILAKRAFLIKPKTKRKQPFWKYVWGGYKIHDNGK